MLKTYNNLYKSILYYINFIYNLETFINILKIVYYEQ